MNVEKQKCVCSLIVQQHELSFYLQTWLFVAQLNKHESSKPKINFLKKISLLSFLCVALLNKKFFCFKPVYIVTTLLLLIYLYYYTRNQGRFKKFSRHNSDINWWQIYCLFFFVLIYITLTPSPQANNSILIFNLSIFFNF